MLVAETKKMGHLELTADHKFSKLKILEYINLSIQYTDRPMIVINGVVNKRPAVGTEFNISGVAVEVLCLTFDGNRTKTGVKIELS